MPYQQLQEFKRLLQRFWFFSPERLWRASIALTRRGHWVLAFWLKQVNGFIYHNSLSPGATLGRGVWLGHNGLGVVVNPNVEIGNNVMIWHNVTLTAGRPERRGGPREGPGVSRIVVEDDVVIGAGAILFAPRGATMRIGRGATIGAGTVVTCDVPPRARIVGAKPRIEPAEEPAAESG